MMKNYYHETPFDLIRRETLRSLLEILQARHIDRLLTDTLANEEEDHDGLEVEELLNNAYMNRGEVPLAMDIFKPVVPEEQELPVIVVIHGGALVVGDRTFSRRYSRALARRGYLVFTLEYRLVPQANIAEQFDDVCAGMDLVGRKLVDFNVDFSRMFLTADSAGTFLAIYVAAMRGSQKLQDGIGYKASHMVFRALGMNCGMFYVNRPDLIGTLLREQIFGKKRYDEQFCKLMDLEDPEVVENLPPVFFVTSRGDFLNRYTLDYHKTLKEAGKTTRLVYYGEEDLEHDFPIFNPGRPQSRDSIDRMLKWFEEQADAQREAKNKGGNVK